MRDLSSASGHIVVLDLEFTAWEGSIQGNWSRPGEYREIVQFGAVKLLSSDLSECASYERLVKPIRNPQLSAYLTRLTGITQEMVDADGVTFQTALGEFVAFADDGPIYSNGADGCVLLENCDLRQIAHPFRKEQFRDIRGELARHFQTPPEGVNSSELNALLGLTPGQAHNALSDARAVAAALRHAWDFRTD